MTKEPFIAHSELTNEIYIVVGKEKYRVTEQAIKAVMAIKALEQESILDKLRAEITILQNRCYALTKGTMCAFCKYECEYKEETEAEDGTTSD